MLRGTVPGSAIPSQLKSPRAPNRNFEERREGVCLGGHRYAGQRHSWTLSDGGSVCTRRECTASLGKARQRGASAWRFRFW